YRPKIDASKVLTTLRLNPQEYFLVSAHREENVDSPERLQQLLDCLVAVFNRWQLPVIVSTHPRTRKRLEALNHDLRTADIRWLEPFGFHDYNKLQLEAACTLSDSGTISEEASILGFPAVTLRDSIERPEALDTGSIIMTGLDAENVVETIVAVRSEDQVDSETCEYSVRDTSNRVVRFILSTWRRHSSWAGIVKYGG